MEVVVIITMENGAGVRLLAIFNAIMCDGIGKMGA